MTFAEKYDRLGTGIISGSLLPLIISLFVFLFSEGYPDIGLWITRLKMAGITTHIISLCVFPNVLVFLLFNHFDMLRAARGMLAATVVWAILVLIVRVWL
jgi:hypothetical protein